MLVATVAFLYSSNYCIQSFIFKKEYPTFFGLSHIRVQGNSMLPTIKSNSLLFTIKAKRYEVGDIICFKQDGYFVVHRIVDIEETIVITKGDNNKECDEKINLDQIYGKVLFVK